MRLLFSLILFTLACAMGFPLLAEGNCPPGYYPIGGQGAVGCAPINNQGGAQHHKQQENGKLDGEFSRKIRPHKR